MEKDLLLVLSEKIGCMYLSDLKFIEDKGKIKSELKKILPQDFTLKQWNDAITYLTGQEKEFSSKIDAKRFLIATEFIRSQPVRRFGS